MTSPTKKTGFVSNEPNVVAHIVLGLLAIVGELVVGHTHLVTSAQWSSATTIIAPILTAFIVTVSAAFWRKYLSPAWKVVQKDLEKTGFTAEQEQAILKLIEGAVGTALDSRQQRPVTLVVDHPLPFAHVHSEG